MVLLLLLLLLTMTKIIRVVLKGKKDLVDFGLLPNTVMEKASRHYTQQNFESSGNCTSRFRNQFCGGGGWSSHHQTKGQPLLADTIEHKRGHIFHRDGSLTVGWTVATLCHCGFGCM